MVIAHNNFRDEEYTATRKKLEGNDVKITVASTVQKEDAYGSQGMTVQPDILIDDVNPDDYDAVVFIGGTGASQYWHDVNAHNIATSACRKEKLVAASSHAVVTLAVAGLLKDRKVTGHVAIYEKLKVQGAQYTGRKLEIDNNIITSTGANAAKEFAEAVAKAI